MAKAKATPTPQHKTEKAAKPKAAKATAAAPKASHKSQEYVVDSDDEDAAPADRSVKQVTAPVPVAKNKKNGSTKAAPAPAGPARKLPAMSSDEDEDDGDSESDGDGEDGKEVLPPPQPNQAPAKVNGVKRAASESVASEEEDDEESEEEQDEPAPKRQKAEPVSAAEAASSSEEESEEEEESEPSPSKRQPSTAGVHQAQISSKARRQDAAEPASEAIAASPFQPPPGYTKLDMASVDVVDDLDDRALAGMQVWHLTAPADVPLSAMTEVALDALQSGRSVLSHKGTDYALNEDKVDDKHTTVFLPGHGGFAPSQQRIQKTLHLQQKISLPNLTMRQANQSTGSAAAANIAEAAVSSVRPQPRGLRMRYRPPGYGIGELGVIGTESSEEDAVKGSTGNLQFPKALGAHGTSTQQSNAGAEQPNGPVTKPKKKRKEKQKDPLAVDAVANGHHREKSAVATGTAVKKVALPEADADVTMVDAAAPAKLSKEEKEEKARRKEEKRLRKEGKLKQKTT